MIDDHGHLVVESKEDFVRCFGNWEVLRVEEWKPGVKRVHLRYGRSPAGFRLVYCQDEYLPEIIHVAHISL
jgi:hypothetical protein